MRSVVGGSADCDVTATCPVSVDLASVREGRYVGFAPNALSFFIYFKVYTVLDMLRITIFNHLLVVCNNICAV